MINKLDQLLIEKFVIKRKRERYLNFLSTEKRRNGFTGELYHFNDFNWELFREIHGSEKVSEVITELINKKKITPTCYVISTNSKFDGKHFSLTEAIEEILGTEATLIIFGNADIVYYEGEPPFNRYITL